MHILNAKEFFKVDQNTYIYIHSLWTHFFLATLNCFVHCIYYNLLSGQTKQQQSLQLLQLLVYTAAETGAQEFIEIIFSTSAGRTVFYSYKDKTPLPEDVARANGHAYLAQYLRDVNTRYIYQIS